MNDVIELIKSNKKYLTAYFMAGVVVYGYYIFSTALYLDDYTRLISYHGWDADGRMLQTWFYRLVSGFRSMHHLGHFAQLVAIALLSLLALLLADKYSPRVNGYSMFLSLALLFFPYTHDIMKYRYDSMGMALALLLACLPLLIPYDTKSKKAKLHHFIIGFLLLLTSFSTYQLAITAFVGLVIVDFISSLVKGEQVKKAMKTVFYWASILTTAVVVYFVLRKTGVINSGNGWVDERATMVQGQPLERVALIVANITTYIKNSYHTFKIGSGNSIGLFGVVVVAVAYAVQQLFTTIVRPAPHKLLRVVLVMASLLLLFFVPGLLILFSNEMVVQGRYLYGASVVFTTVLLIFGQTAGYGYLSRVKKILLVWFVLLLTSNTAVYFADLTLDIQIEQNKGIITGAELNLLGNKHLIKTIEVGTNVEGSLNRGYIVPNYTSFDFSNDGKYDLKQFTKVGTGSFYDFYLGEEAVIMVVAKAKEDNE